MLDTFFKQIDVDQETIDALVKLATHRKETTSNIPGIDDGYRGTMVLGLEDQWILYCVRGDYCVSYYTGPHGLGSIRGLWLLEDLTTTGAVTADSYVESCKDYSELIERARQCANSGLGVTYESVEYLLLVNDQVIETGRFDDSGNSSYYTIPCTGRIPDQMTPHLMIKYTESSKTPVENTTKANSVYDRMAEERLTLIKQWLGGFFHELTDVHNGESWSLEGDGTIISMPAMDHAPESMYLIPADTLSEKFALIFSDGFSWVLCTDTHVRISDGTWTLKSFHGEVLEDDEVIDTIMEMTYNYTHLTNLNSLTLKK